MNVQLGQYTELAIAYFLMIYYCKALKDLPSPLLFSYFIFFLLFLPLHIFTS